jgi:hypothetical protein
MAGVIFKAGEVFEISRVCELVEIDDEAVGMLGKHHPHKIAADEPGAARDQ